jgi:uncharacterized protein YcfL
MKTKYFFLIIGLIILTSCESDKVAKSFTLSELEKNSANALKIPVEKKVDFLALCKEMATSDINKLSKRLQKKNVGLIEVSYGFYFLGSRYLEKDDFDKGLNILHIAADLYLNPLAMHKLAVIYAQTAEEIRKNVRAGQARNFKQDFEKSYFYIHRSINTAIMTMETFNDRTIVDDINKYALPLIELFEKKDSTILKNFNNEAALSKGKRDVQLIRSEFDKLYKTN